MRREKKTCITCWRRPYIWLLAPVAAAAVAVAGGRLYGILDSLTAGSGSQKGETHVEEEKDTRGGRGRFPRKARCADGWCEFGQLPLFGPTSKSNIKGRSSWLSYGRRKGTLTALHGAPYPREVARSTFLFLRVGKRACSVNFMLRGCQVELQGALGR